MMKNETLSGMLLFSVELGNYPYKYRLYFVDQRTLETESPRMHCFYLTRRRDFNSLTLGGVYTLLYSGLRITSMILDNTFVISDADYFFLNELRDCCYLDRQSTKHVELDNGRYSARDYYYDFATAKDIFCYDPPKHKKFFIFFIRLAAYLLSMFIPVAIYLLFIYASTLWTEPAWHTILGSISVPVVSLFSIPFLIWMMLLLFTLCEMLLLNIDYTRYSLLRLYFLRWGGMRKSCFIEPYVRIRLKRVGIISFALLVIGILFAFFIF